jgi:hypothetical protein
MTTVVRALIPPRRAFLSSEPSDTLAEQKAHSAPKRHDARVAESLGSQFLHSDVEVPCPECGYLIWIRYAEIVVQTAVWCPCCRIRIWLRDAEGGMQTIGDAIERQFEQTLKDLWK